MTLARHASKSNVKSNLKTKLTISQHKDLHKKEKSAKDGISNSRNHSLIAMKVYTVPTTVDQELPSVQRTPVKLNR